MFIFLFQVDSEIVRENGMMLKFGGDMEDVEEDIEGVLFMIIRM